MGRTRVHPDSQTYHLMARGNNRRRIFDDDIDRTRFLELLTSMMSSRGWSGYAYCLMDNHVHLLVATQNVDVADGMRDLLGQHASRYNRRHGRTGHLFSERYRRVGIDNDAHLLTTLRYIALNPVRAGLVECPEDWPWSSYTRVLEGAPETECVPALAVLPFFHPLGPRARELFRRFVGTDQTARRPSVSTLVQVLGCRRAVPAAARTGWTHAEIARFLGVGRPAITKRLLRVDTGGTRITRDLNASPAASVRNPE